MNPLMMAAAMATVVAKMREPAVVLRVVTVPARAVVAVKKVAKMKVKMTRDTVPVEINRIKSKFNATFQSATTLSARAAGT
jgi:hypothetical protein